MLKYLLRVNALSRMQTHDLIEKIDEVSISCPFVSLKIEPFLKSRHEVAQPLSKKLVLLSHDLLIVAASNTEESHIDSAMAI